MEMKKEYKKMLAGFCFAVSIAASPFLANAESVMWINHLDFLPGDPSVVTTFNAVNSGVGGGLTGLIINSTTSGEVADGGGNKVVMTGVAVPPGFLVNGVRLCYELTTDQTFVSQIRLAQVQDPPASALVLLDDGTDHTAMGPVCVDSSLPPSGPIDPADGPLLLSFRVNFDDPMNETTAGDAIVIRGVGLYVIPAAAEDLQLQLDGLRHDLGNHGHKYLTGKGVGHNNTLARSGPAYFSSTPIPQITPAKVKVVKKAAPAASNSKKK